MNHLISFLITSILFATSNSQPINSLNNDEIEINDEVSIESVNHNSLLFYTNKSIVLENRELTELMDTLYQYVCSDTFISDNVDSNAKFMDSYRYQLCNYFNKKYNCDNSISNYSKADSVINEAHYLFAKYPNYSTIGMITDNQAEYSRLKFKQYNQYTKLLESCKTQNEKQILMRE